MAENHNSAVRDPNYARIHGNLATSYFETGTVDLVIAKREKSLVGMREDERLRTFEAELQIVEVGRVSLPAGVTLTLGIDLLEELLLNGNLPAELLRTRLDEMFERVKRQTNTETEGSDE